MDTLGDDFRPLQIHPTGRQTGQFRRTRKDLHSLHHTPFVPVFARRSYSISIVSESCRELTHTSMLLGGSLLLLLLLLPPVTRRGYLRRGLSPNKMHTLKCPINVHLYFPLSRDHHSLPIEILPTPSTGKFNTKNHRDPRCSTFTGRASSSPKNTLTDRVHSLNEEQKKKKTSFN